VLKYVRGGFWRSFLAKYPEANDMHKRGLRIDAKLERAENAEARDALWRAQCNCPYWHGVFGGLYLRHIRAATLANLVRAERLADEAAGVPDVVVSEGDYDYDGVRETLIQTPSLSLMLHPEEGGMLSQLDLRERDWAMLGVLTRHREAYHEALLGGSAVDAQHDQPTNIHGSVRVKQQGLGEALILDRFRRGALQEWIVDEAATVEEFSRGEAHAWFEPAGEWEPAVSSGDERASVRLSREHGGWRFVKQIDVPACGEEFRVSYECTNATDEQRRARFVSEWNLSPPQAVDGDDRIARFEYENGSTDLAGPPGAVEGISGFTTRGSARWGLRAETSEPVLIWHFPVESVSSSEGGLERVWQGASLSLVRALDLAPGETLGFSIHWRVVDVKPLTLQA
jgi:alpha-amylase